MRVRAHHVVACLLAAAVLASPGPAWADPDTDPVGAIVDDEQRIQCTATLLSSDTVLTAAHCVAQDGVVRWPWGFLLGEDVSLGGVFARVLDGAVHPQYDDFLHSGDLAVLRVAGGAPRPAFLDIDSAVPKVGASVRVVGFGAGAVGPDRREAEVTSQGPDSFRYEPGTCPGDSGGPVLVGDDVPLVAGVVSTGAAGCATARAIAVAPHADWIHDAMEFLDPLECRADGRCGEDCRLGDADCPCIEGDGSCRLCAGIDPDCSASCDTDGTCVTSCLAPDPDCRTLSEGAACAQDAECASSICFEAVCREPCSASTGVGCPPWAACLPVADDMAGVCVPYEDAQVLGGCAAGGNRTGGAAALAFLWLVVAARRARRWMNTDRQKRKGE